MQQGRALVVLVEIYQNHPRLVHGGPVVTNAAKAQEILASFPINPRRGGADMTKQARKQGFIDWPLDCAGNEDRGSDGAHAWKSKSC